MAPWVVTPPELARNRTNALAILTGCPLSSTELLVNCLREISTFELLQVYPRFYVIFLNFHLLSFSDERSILPLIFCTVICCTLANALITHTSLPFPLYFQVGTERRIKLRTEIMKKLRVLHNNLTLIQIIELYLC